MRARTTTLRCRPTTKGRAEVALCAYFSTGSGRPLLRVGTADPPGSTDPRAA
jgi:hypothetical protein